MSALHWVSILLMCHLMVLLPSTYVKAAPVSSNELEGVGNNVHLADTVRTKRLSDSELEVKAGVGHESTEADISEPVSESLLQSEHNGTHSTNSSQEQEQLDEKNAADEDHGSVESSTDASSTNNESVENELENQQKTSNEYENNFTVNPDSEVHHISGKVSSNEKLGELQVGSAEEMKDFDNEEKGDYEDIDNLNEPTESPNSQVVTSDYNADHLGSSMPFAGDEKKSSKSGEDKDVVNNNESIDGYEDEAEVKRSDNNAEKDEDGDKSAHKDVDDEPESKTDKAVEHNIVGDGKDMLHDKEENHEGNRNIQGDILVQNPDEHKEDNNENVDIKEEAVPHSEHSSDIDGNLHKENSELELSVSEPDDNIHIQTGDPNHQEETSTEDESINHLAGTSEMLPHTALEGNKETDTVTSSPVNSHEENVHATEQDAEIIENGNIKIEESSLPAHLENLQPLKMEDSDEFLPLQPNHAQEKGSEHILTGKLDDNVDSSDSHHAIHATTEGYEGNEKSGEYEVAPAILHETDKSNGGDDSSQDNGKIMDEEVKEGNEKLESKIEHNDGADDKEKSISHENEKDEHKIIVPGHETTVNPENEEKSNIVPVNDGIHDHSGVTTSENTGNEEKTSATELNVNSNDDNENKAVLVGQDEKESENNDDDDFYDDEDDDYDYDDDSVVVTPNVVEHSENNDGDGVTKSSEDKNGALTTENHGWIDEDDEDNEDNVEDENPAVPEHLGSNNKNEDKYDETDDKGDNGSYVKPQVDGDNNDGNVDGATTGLPSSARADEHSEDGGDAHEIGKDNSKLDTAASPENEVDTRDFKDNLSDWFATVYVPLGVADKAKSNESVEHTTETAYPEVEGSGIPIFDSEESSGNGNSYGIHKHWKESKEAESDSENNNENNTDWVDSLLDSAETTDETSTDNPNFIDHSGQHIDEFDGSGNEEGSTSGLPVTETPVERTYKKMVFESFIPPNENEAETYSKAATEGTSPMQFGSTKDQNQVEVTTEHHHHDHKVSETENAYSQVTHESEEAAATVSSKKLDSIVQSKPGDNGSVNEILIGSEASGSDTQTQQSSTGSYVVLGVIMAIIVLLLGYSVFRSKRRNQAEKPEENFGTEMKDIEKTLLPANGNGNLYPDPHPEDDEDEDESKVKLLPQMEEKGDDTKENDLEHNETTVEDLERSSDILSKTDSPFETMLQSHSPPLTEKVVEVGRHKSPMQAARERFFNIDLPQQNASELNGQKLSEVVIEKIPSTLGMPHNGLVNGDSEEPATVNGHLLKET